MKWLTFTAWNIQQETRSFSVSSGPDRNEKNSQTVTSESERIALTIWKRGFSWEQERPGTSDLRTILKNKWRFLNKLHYFPPTIKPDERTEEICIWIWQNSQIVTTNSQAKCTYSEVPERTDHRSILSCAIFS